MGLLQERKFRESTLCSGPECKSGSGVTLVVTVPSVQDVAAPPCWSLGGFRLRPLRLSDAPAFHAYLSDPRVIDHTSFPHLDLPAVEAMIARQLEGYAAATSCRWALVDASDLLIGTCGFTNWSLPHAHAELAYDLSPTFWGRGLMRAAARQVLSWRSTPLGSIACTRLS